MSFYHLSTYESTCYYHVVVILFYSEVLPLFGRRPPFNPLYRREEVMLMTAFEILSVVLTIDLLIVSIIALCIKSKK